MEASPMANWTPAACLLLKRRQENTALFVVGFVKNCNLNVVGEIKKVAVAICNVVSFSYFAPRHSLATLTG
jgi:hypothetical protein